MVEPPTVGATPYDEEGCLDGEAIYTAPRSSVSELCSDGDCIFGLGFDETAAR